jgi:hypothetical protein
MRQNEYLDQRFRRHGSPVFNCSREEASKKKRVEKCGGFCKFPEIYTTASGTRATVG